jgi:hypothetical protein
MPTAINDLDADSVIARLARPLSSAADRDAFAAAARAALAAVPVRGERAIYRAVSSLQHSFRTPPSDRNAHWDIEQELRDTKLKSAPPIEYGGDGRHKHAAR